MSLKSTDVEARIRAPKLYHMVAEHLRAKIGSGALKFGDTLPSESELIKQLGISRPTLREALRVLESEGLIQLARGARAGASVLAPSIETAAKYGELYLASQGTTLGEINEVRMLVEPPLVSMLARRAKRDFVRILKQCVTKQREALEADDYPGAMRAISDFHGQLIEFSQNRALGLLVGMLREIMPDAYAKLWLTGSESTQKALRRRTVKSSESHEKLLEIILRHQPSEAEAFWRSYMEDTAAFLTETKMANVVVDVPTRRY
jgi:DNA-binding FadR family transcriptional regulator